MDKVRFIESYVAAFLAARAAQRYETCSTWKWVYEQPVEDARYLAEQAWASLEKQAKPSTAVTTGNVVTATTATDSIPIT